MCIFSYLWPWIVLNIRHKYIYFFNIFLLYVSFFNSIVILCPINAILSFSKSAFIVFIYSSILLHLPPAGFGALPHTANYWRSDGFSTCERLLLISWLARLAHWGTQKWDKPCGGLDIWVFFAKFVESFVSSSSARQCFASCFSTWSVGPGTFCHGSQRCSLCRFVCTLYYSGALHSWASLQGCRATVYNSISLGSNSHECLLGYSFVPWIVDLTHGSIRFTSSGTFKNGGPDWCQS